MHLTTSATLLTPSLPLHHLPHLLSLNQSFSCFLQFVSSILPSVSLVYLFHSLHVPIPSSKHLPQVVPKHDHTTSHHWPLPAYLLFPSIPTCPSAPLYPLIHQLYTAHNPHQKSFCSSQNNLSWV